MQLLGAAEPARAHPLADGTDIVGQVMQSLSRFLLISRKGECR